MFSKRPREKKEKKRKRKRKKTRKKEEKGGNKEVFSCKIGFDTAENEPFKIC